LQWWQGRASQGKRMMGEPEVYIGNSG
jgi:hypothetical protein